MKDNPETPLQSLPKTATKFDEVGMEGFALANLRERYHLGALIKAVDSGEIPADVPCPYELPTIATALRGWSRWDTPKEKKGEEASEAGDLARFHSGKTWNGVGHLHFSEMLVAALFRAGATLFPEGPEEKQFENLATAISEDARATATSLLLSPQCPDLTSSTHASHLLSKALREGQSEVVRAMLDKGVDPNRRVQSPMNKDRPAWFFAKTPIHLRWLLEAGADPMATSEDGLIAQQVWAKGGVSSKALKEMGEVLSKKAAVLDVPSGSASQSPEVLGAFVSAGSLRIGDLKQWIAQDSLVLSGSQPIPGFLKEKESLVQKVVRTYLFEKNFDQSARESGARGNPVLGVLKLFLQRQGVEEGERGLVALTALAMGSVLGSKETSSRRMWSGMQGEVEDILESDSTREAAWRELGHVFRRVSMGATFGGVHAGSRGFWIGSSEPDDPKREEHVYAKMGEFLSAMERSNTPIGKKARDPALVGRMFATWAPAFHGKEGRDLGHRLVQHMDSSPQLCMTLRGAAYSPQQDRVLSSEFMQHMYSDSEVSLGALVSLVLCGRGDDLLQRLVPAIQRWEKSARWLAGSSFSQTAKELLERLMEREVLHPELARVNAEWESRMMDKKIPQALVSRPSQSRF